MIYLIRQFLQPVIAAMMSFIMSVGAAFGITSESVEIAPEDYDQVQNVIYLIGDGMGYKHLEKASQERDVELTLLNDFEIQGWSKTSSATDIVTDSAAGGTALSCGVRTKNGALGVYWFDLNAKESHPKSLTELCAENGMKTGVITTDSTSGATPSAFSVHTSDRDNTEDIDTQQMNSQFDLIWGCTSAYTNQETIEANGFTYVKTYADMMALEEGGRSFAQFDNQTWGVTQHNAETPTLSQMAEKAIDLLDDTDEGFFLMIEGAHIDKHSHSNYDEGMVEAAEEFDNTVELALEYAKADGNTLVVVTADHETGGIILNKDGSYSFTSKGHSATNVPVFVYGSENLIQDGETLKNKEIPVRIAYSLGFGAEDLPYEVFEEGMEDITDLDISGFTGGLNIEF